MELNIQYRNLPIDQLKLVEAFFIEGNSIEKWLEVISSYQLSLEEIQLYIVPTSLENPIARGLFVILPMSKEASHFSFPFQKIGEKLFIPLNAVLFPVMQEEELNQQLLWDIQLFHPSVGLIGYSITHQFEISEHLVFLPNQETAWNKAKGGIKESAKLSEIRVTKSSMEDMLDSLVENIQEDIGGKKELKDLKPKEEEKSTIQKVKDEASFRFFEGVQKMLDSLKTKETNQSESKQQNNTSTTTSESTYSNDTLTKLLSYLFSLFPSVSYDQGNNGSITKQNYVNASYEDKEGLFKRFENWVQQNLDEINKKREDEMKRLMDLFDEDSDQALQYAIPLNSPYAGRGGESEHKSSELSKQNTDFSISKLGGAGGKTDSWDIDDDQYYILQQKYRKAAEDALNKKDYRKAAYVYAHLLGDYAAAANVLEQGKFYHEAVTIYKEHLHNLPAAAECYEKAGMFLDAIDVYLELSKNGKNHFEKIADLYTEIGQNEKATNYYQICVDNYVQHQDYISAYELTKNKLYEREKSKELLLEAWEYKHQGDYCLREYFLLEAEDNEEELSHKVDQLYRGLDSSEKIDYLKVLNKVQQQYQEADFMSNNQRIAYEIVSGELQENRRENLALLRKFIPEDPLLAAASGRFLKKPISKVSKKNQKERQELFTLSTEIQWKSVVNFDTNYLVFGLNKDQHLVVFRGNLYGDLETYIWDVKITDWSELLIQAQPKVSNHIVLFSEHVIGPKKMPKNSKFDDEIWIGGLPNAMNNPLRIAINHNENYVVIDESASLQYYSLDGKLLQNKTVTTNQNFQLLSQITPLFIQLNISLDEYDESFSDHENYVTFAEDSIFIIEEDKSSKITKEINTDYIYSSFLQVMKEINTGSKITHLLPANIWSSMDNYVLVVNTESISLYDTEEHKKECGLYLFEPEEELIAIKIFDTQVVVVIQENSFVAEGSIHVNQKIVVFNLVLDEDIYCEIIGEQKVLSNYLIQDILLKKDENTFCFVERSGKVVSYQIEE